MIDVERKAWLEEDNPYQDQRPARRPEYAYEQDDNYRSSDRRRPDHDPYRDRSPERGPR